jgi:hypothetical protein
LREAFEEEAIETGNERLLLTAAVAGAKNTIDKVEISIREPYGQLIKISNFERPTKSIRSQST